MPSTNPLSPGKPHGGLALACLMLLAGSINAAANLLVNPSFESPVIAGDGLGWDRRGTTNITLTQVTDPVIHGLYALEVSGRTDFVWNGIRQDLTTILTPGKMYRIKGHVRMSAGEADDTIRIKLLTTTGGVEKLLAELTNVSDSQYEAFVADFEFAEEDTALSVNGPAVNASFLVDYFTIEELPNLLVNPDFEDLINPTDGSHVPISSFNAARAKGLDMPPFREFWFESSKGRRIHSWLALPPGFDESKKYPLVLQIHGGPFSSSMDAGHVRWNAHLLASPGYVVLLTDYTGSVGYGEQFSRNIYMDPLKTPGEELLEAAAEAARRFPFIDDTRQAATGAS